MSDGTTSLGDLDNRAGAGPQAQVAPQSVDYAKELEKAGVSQISPTPRAMAPGVGGPPGPGGAPRGQVQQGQVQQGQVQQGQAPGQVLQGQMQQGHAQHGQVQQGHAPGHVQHGQVQQGHAPGQVQQGQVQHDQVQQGQVQQGQVQQGQVQGQAPRGRARQPVGGVIRPGDGQPRRQGILDSVLDVGNVAVVAAAATLFAVLQTQAAKTAIGRLHASMSTVSSAGIQSLTSAGSCALVVVFGVTFMAVAPVVRNYAC